MPVDVRVRHLTVGYERHDPLPTGHAPKARAFHGPDPLILAVVRGLLLDLLATGDRAGATSAMELFLRRSAAALGFGAAGSG